ncbi:MAG TPA: class II fumarate hydratase [Chloroflexota bacterium]|nr:class II fumarate hydratase [Chloroflexota bacterium]
MTLQNRTRLERDTMGEMEVPADAYYGAQTQRAIQNFPISDLRFPRRFIEALGLIKGAAAEVNMNLGLLDRQKGDAIVQAAREVVDGTLDAPFPLDIFQTGSGTSTNTNANEVIAHRANELLGVPLGQKGPVHPNDDVNKGQSSNDVIPTAIHLSGLLAMTGELLPALEVLREALQEKSQQLWPVIKTGRTHLQDATPIRLGQVFLGYAGQIERAIQRVQTAQGELAELALGGTAVGTGINTHPDFARRVVERVSGEIGIPLHETTNHFQAQSTIDNVVAAHGELKTVAVSLIKIANDIRWMGSGPRAGIGEITVPELQPGSSIMPGKVNPVIAESAIMAAFQVVGNDATITLAGQSGNFELNVALPIVAYDLLQSIHLLAASSRNLAEKMVRGIDATGRGPEMVEKGLMLATALAPEIGYDQAAAIAKEAAATGRTIREVARERTDLSDEQLDQILDPEAMVEPGKTVAGAGG